MRSHAGRKVCDRSVDLEFHGNARMTFSAWECLSILIPAGVLRPKHPRGSSRVRKPKVVGERWSPVGRKGARPQITLSRLWLDQDSTRRPCGTRASGLDVATSMPATFTDMSHDSPAHGHAPVYTQCPLASTADSASIGTT